MSDGQSDPEIADTPIFYELKYRHYPARWIVQSYAPPGSEQ